MAPLTIPARRFCEKYPKRKAELDSAAEVACMSNTTLKTVPSIWGHFCGAGINPVDTDFIDQAVKECLAE